MKISYILTKENGTLTTTDLDQIDINNCLETSLERTYEIHDEGEIELSFLYRKSKIDHFLLRIATTEQKIAQNKNNIIFLENAILYLERNSI